MARHRSSSLVALVAVGALAAALAGCGGSDSPSATDSGGAYQWGIDAELSGTVAYYGTTLQAGIQAYVDEVNAAGGINGHKIELTALDNGGDGSKASTVATQLITANKVDALFGNVLSANCTAVTPVVERYKVPIGCLSVDQPSDYVYGLGANNTRIAGAALAAAKQVVGKDTYKAAVMTLNTLTGLQFGKDINAQGAAAGADIVSSQTLDLSTADVSTPVAKAVASKPDVLIVSEFGPGLVSVVKGIRAAGLDIPVVWLDGTGNLNSLAESTDPNIYALTVYKAVDPENASGAAQDYIDAITPSLKGKTDVVSLNAGYSIASYITAKAFGDALKACGYPCSGEQLKEQLDSLKTDYPGLVDGFGYDAGHYPYPNFYLYKVVGSKYTLAGTFPAARQ